jgi:hypothetical protein
VDIVRGEERLSKGFTEYDRELTLMYHSQEE